MQGGDGAGVSVREVGEVDGSRAFGQDFVGGLDEFAVCPAGFDFPWSAGRFADDVANKRVKGGAVVVVIALNDMAEKPAAGKNIGGADNAKGSGAVQVLANPFALHFLQGSAQVGAERWGAVVVRAEESAHGDLRGGEPSGERTPLGLALRKDEYGDACERKHQHGGGARDDTTAATRICPSAGGVWVSAFFFRSHEYHYIIFC